MDRRQLKSESKSLMRTGSPRPIFVSLIYIVILIIFSILSYKLVSQPINEFLDSQFGDIYSGFLYGTADYSDFEKVIDSYDPMEFFTDYMEHAPSGTARLLNALLTLLGFVIAAGFIIFTLHTVDGTDASIWNLFDGFEMCFRIIWLRIVECIFIALWALLLIFPAFIAAYSYRMAIYILLENPEMSVMDCIRESKRLMRGHKAELFVLDLSFIGWFLLIGFVTGLGNIFLPELFTYVGLGNIVYVWVLPFMHITFALYYRRLTAPKDLGDYVPEL